MADILILYGSVHGQTARIAERIGAQLQANGARVAMREAGSAGEALALEGFDGIIVAAPVRYGRHPRAVRHFARDYRHVLNAIPSAFVSVSSSAASPDPVYRAQARQYVEQFLRQTGWRPTLTEAVGGAIAYSRYNPVLRWMTKRAVSRFTGPLDSSHDHEYTDWLQVERFADAFAERVAQRQSDLARVV